MQMHIRDRHLAEALADSDALERAGSFALAWVRRRDASFLLRASEVDLSRLCAAPPARKDDSPMAKSPHPVEVYEASIIAGAVSWTAFQFRGARNAQKFESADRPGAEGAARAMLADYPERPVLIYAINAEGRQAVADTLRAR